MEKIDKKYYGLIFASLFHDVGKFIQKTNYTEKYRSKREKDICPVNQKGGYLTHKHVSYTDGFLTEINSLFGQESLSTLFADSPFKSVFHHKSELSDTLELIIQKADRYSSGSDRILKETKDEGQWNEIPLISILSIVNVKDDVSSKKRVNLKPLEPEYFLSAIKDNSFILSKDIYTEFWDEFNNEFMQLFEQFYNIATALTNQKYLTFFRALNSLVEKYWWCIPSSVIDESDISLYDHSVTTSAIASVLYKYHLETGTLNDRRKVEDNTIPKFILISGDVSGIQNYIFDVKKSSFSAKTLRARSFQIQSLTENISGFILQQLDLPVFCRILNAAGRFQILLPNTESVKNKLNYIKKKVEEEFKKQFFGELTFNISEPVIFSGEDFKIDNFQRNVLNKLHEKIEMAKLNKLSYVLNSSDDFILEHEYAKFTSNQDLCPLCEKHPIRTARNDLNICEYCAEIIDTGTELPKIKFIKWDFENFMLFPEFIKENNVQEFDFSFSISRINTFSLPFYRYSSPFYVPVDDYRNVLTFEELSEKAEGVKYLAMFKADVDNLGLIFLTGFGNKKSISRIASLSRTLHFFFSEYLNYFVQKNYPDIYIVFSGGDDVCLVGPWDKVIDFAIDFHKEFERFTGNNKSITMSASITLFHHNYPIKNVAEESEELLKKAKTHSPEKNAVNLFNVICDWQTLENKIKDGDSLIDKAKREVITKGMIYRLLEYARMKENVEKNGKYSDAIWRSKLYYDVARNLNVSKKDAKEIKEKILVEFNRLLSERAGKISVSYAIYKTRN